MSSRSFLFPMADSLVSYTAQEFLEDENAFAWGRCSSTLLKAMRFYRISRTISLCQLLLRSEGKGLLPALESEEFRTDPDYWPGFWPDSDRYRPRLLALLTAALTPESSGTAGGLSQSDALASLYSAEIGRVCNVEIDPVVLENDLILTRLALLPPSVTNIRLNYYSGSHPVRLSSTCTTLTIGSLVETPAVQTMEFPERGLQQLVFDDVSNFNYSLDLLRLPSTLHTLHLGKGFNQPIERLELPDSLTDLILGTEDFNQPVESLRLPQGLRSLRFAPQFNHPIEQLRLPFALTYLHLGRKFNHPLAEWHPPTSLNTLVLGDYWHYSADQLRLPPGLLDLCLPLAFNHPITDTLMPLPSTLRSFESWGCFNQSLVDITWPKSLTSLTLDGLFCQPLDDWTPPSQLLKLSLGKYEWPIHRLRLPPSLTGLRLNLKLNDPAKEVEWPPLLRNLNLRIAQCHSPLCVIPTLPCTLKKLTLSGLGWSRPPHPPEIIRAWLSLPLPPDCEREGDSIFKNFGQPPLPSPTMHMQPTNTTLTPDDLAHPIPPLPSPLNIAPTTQPPHSSSDTTSCDSHINSSVSVAHTSPLSTSSISPPVSRLYRDVLHHICQFLDLTTFVCTCLVNHHWYACGRTMKPRKESLIYHGPVGLLAASPLRIHISQLFIGLDTTDTRQLEARMRHMVGLDGKDSLLLRNHMDHLESLSIILTIPSFTTNMNHEPMVDDPSLSPIWLPHRLRELTIHLNSERLDEHDVFTYASANDTHVRAFVNECMKQIAVQSPCLVKLAVQLWCMGGMDCPEVLQSLTSLTDCSLPYRFSLNSQIDLIKSLPSIRRFHSQHLLTSEAIARLLNESDSSSPLEDLGVVERVDETIANHLIRLTTLTQLETSLFMLYDPTPFLRSFPRLMIATILCWSPAVNVNHLTTALSTCGVSLTHLTLFHEELTSDHISLFLPHMSSLILFKLSTMSSICSLQFLTTAKPTQLRSFTIDASVRIRHRIPLNEYEHLRAIASSIESIAILRTISPEDAIMIDHWRPNSSEFNREEWPKLLEVTITPYLSHDSDLEEEDAGVDYRSDSDRSCVTDRSWRTDDYW